MTSSSARPARISSGTGTELALSPTGGAASRCPSGGSFAGRGTGRRWRGSCRWRLRRRGPAVAVFRGRIGLRGRGSLAAQLGLERARDVLLRARVVAHVAREALDRVVVAVDPRRCRRCGRPATSRRPPGGRRTERRWLPARWRRAARRTQPARTAARRARLDGWWRVAGVKSRGGSRAAAARTVRAILQSLSDGVDARVNDR